MNTFGERSKFPIININDIYYWKYESIHGSGQGHGYGHGLTLEITKE